MQCCVAGSEGKLTITAQRTSMLTAIGYLASNTVTGQSAQKVALQGMQLYVPLLKTEG